MLFRILILRSNMVLFREFPFSAATISNSFEFVRQAWQVPGTILDPLQLHRECHCFG
jgi:hypothetical protein